MTKRVLIACDHCNDTLGTDEHIERIARWYNETTDRIHEVLYDDLEIQGGHIVLEGCHVVRIGEDATSA